MPLKLRLKTYQASTYEKQGAGDNCTHCKIQRLQTCKKSHASCQVGVWWRAMIIPFRRPQFFSFTMRCTNYNQIEIKTGLKRIQERVLPRKSTSKACQNIFYVCITISHYFLLRFWTSWVGCLFHRNIDTLPCSVTPSA